MEIELLIEKSGNNFQQKPSNYWTFEKCKEVAKLCVNRSELLKKYAQAYKVLSRNNLLDELFVNEKDKDANIHCVYQFYFPKTNHRLCGRDPASVVLTALPFGFCSPSRTSLPYIGAFPGLSNCCRSCFHWADTPHPLQSGRRFDCNPDRRWRHDRRLASAVPSGCEWWWIFQLHWGR